MFETYLKANAVHKVGVKEDLVRQIASSELFDIVPGGDIKCDPERENCAVLTIAAQTANSIHIRVTFIVVTRYIPFI